MIDESIVRFLLALGALAALWGALLQAILELGDYRDLVSAATLTDDAKQKLLTQYSQVSYWISFFLWGLVPFYGLYRNFYREPVKLTNKLIASTQLDTSQTARTKTAIRKARNWAVIVFGALFVVAGSLLDLINSFDAA